MLNLTVAGVAQPVVGASVLALGVLLNYFDRVVSAVTAMATGYWSLFVGRFLLGVAEAPSFPAGSKATGYWFSRRERGLATAIFDGSQKFGNVIGGA